VKILVQHGAPTALVGAALDALTAFFGRDGIFHAEWEAAYLHDWQVDQYALGAYSHETVGSNGAREALARPLDDTLFFAGEATSSEGDAGTVAGALEGGDRALKEAECSLE
jgi:monoamine oxidase